MRKLLLLNILLITFLYGFNKNVVDSLNTVLESAPLEQQPEVILKILSYNYSYQKPLSLELIDKGLDVSGKLGYKNLNSELLSFKADHYFNNENYPKALETYYKLINDSTILEDEYLLASSYNNIGIIYDYWSDYPKSLEYYIKSLKIYESLNDTSGLLLTYNNIGIVYANMEENDKALEYYKVNYDISIKRKNKRQEANSLNNIGTILFDKKDYESALDYMTRSYAIYDSLNDPEGIAITTTNIGEVYEVRKDYNKAMEFYQKAYQKDLETKKSDGISISLLRIAGINILKKKYTLALDQLSKSLVYAKKVDLKSRIAEIYEKKYEVYKKIGDDKSALLFFEKFHDIHVKTHNDSKRKEIIEIQNRYEMDKQLEKIKILQKDNLLQKQILQNNKMRNKFYFMSAVLGLAVFLWVSFLYMSKVKLNNQLNNQKKELENSYKELKDAHHEILELEKKTSVLAMIVTANHELNQPLTTLKGNLHLLKMVSENDLTPKQERFFTHINRSVERIESILHKYRSFEDTENIEFVNYAGDEDTKMVIIKPKEQKNS